MINYVQDGEVLMLDPGATVAAGVGHLFGTALFGVAAVDGVSGTASAFRTTGIVSIGDVLYWDATNSVVNKTTSGQRGVGIAVEGASNPSSTVKMRIGINSVVGT